MPKLPILSGKKLLKVFQKHGYRAVRQKGSHVFVENENGNVGTVIPIHGNEDIGKGLLKSILADLELTVEELLKMM
ncbi:type II toxin-antitoxin system HicA family toxin [Candidatus Peregrinibacteria bacterium]|nr:type II toxin-antitoxin system HicA family toxin [Candidatus Peregrinibacteria bacterium]